MINKLFAQGGGANGHKARKMNLCRIYLSGQYFTVKADADIFKPSSSSIEKKKNSYLRAQLCVLHSWVSSFGPSTSHFFPPAAGLGLLHLRVLVCVPPPQVLEQVLHLPHLPYPPSTRFGEDNGKNPQ